MPKRDYAKRPKFFIWDAVLAIPLLMMMVYPRYITLVSVLLVGVVLSLLDRRGMKVPMIARYTRGLFVGARRYIRYPR